MKAFVARTRMRFVLGTSILTIFIGLANLLVFAKIWAPTFQIYGVPPELLYILLPAGYVLGGYLIGFYYDTMGFWKEETSHTNQNLNPEFEQLCRDVADIRRKLE